MVSDIQVGLMLTGSVIDNMVIGGPGEDASASSITFVDSSLRCRHHCYHPASISPQTIMTDTALASPSTSILAQPYRQLSHSLVPLGSIQLSAAPQRRSDCLRRRKGGLPASFGAGSSAIYSRSSAINFWPLPSMAAALSMNGHSAISGIMAPHTC
eukprot:473571-Rhodomonas_salina.2